MMTRIVIQVGNEEFKGLLDDARSPQTVRKVLGALPIQARARTWGDEIYFDIPVDADAENAVQKVKKGDLGYWPEGNCFCIFFGRTPMSRSEDEIIPASAVNVIGSVEKPEGLKKHSAGEAVSIRLAE